MLSHLNPVNSLKPRRIFREPQDCFFSAQHFVICFPANLPARNSWTVENEKTNYQLAKGWRP